MFQRLVAIPQEEYLSMTALRNVKNPLTQHFQSLQQQLMKQTQRWINIDVSFYKLKL